MKWIYKTYFPPFKDGKKFFKWILSGFEENNHIIKMAWTPIKRHIMIKHDYSPYDKTKTDYFNNR